MHVVVIVCEDYHFLLEAYASLHRNQRIHHVEATARREEVIVLIQSNNPDVVIFDVAACDRGSLAALRRLHELLPQLDIIVTYKDRTQAEAEKAARLCGAIGAIARERFTADVFTRLLADVRATRRQPLPAQALPD